MFNQQTLKARANVVVRTWAARIKAAGGGLENNSLVIANNFITVLRSKSYYAKVIYLLPMLGRGINAARVPLIDRQNVGAATNNNFVDADFNQSIGLQSIGFARYFDTLMTGTMIGSTAGVGFWYLSPPADQYYCFAATNAGESLRYGLDLRSAATRFYWGATANEAQDPNPDTAAHYYGQQSASNNRVLCKNGVQVGSSSNVEGNPPITTSLYYMGGNVPSGPYSIIGIGGLGYLTDGTMTADEIQDFHSVLANYLMTPSGKPLS